MTNIQGSIDVRTHVRNYIEDNFLYLHPDKSLSDSDGLLDLGIVDSLGFVELVEEIQERFGIEVQDTEIIEENFGSVDAIVRFVETKRAAA
jgi:acyl carrier protein